MARWFQEHHRNVPYRPPRKVDERKQGPFVLYLRYARQYLIPFKWQLVTCMTIVCLTGASVYLMPFYGRYVVDHVLLVPVSGDLAPVPGSRFDAAPSSRLREPARGETNLPASGANRQRDQQFVAGEHAPGAGRTLFIIFLMHVGSIFILNHLGRIANQHQIIIGQNLAAKLRDDLHRKVLELSLAYHKMHTSGRLLARIMSDVGVVQHQLMLTVIQLAQSSVMVLVGSVILLISDWRIAIIAFLSSPLYALVWYMSREGIKKLAIEARHTNSCMYGLISQKLEGVKAIQAYGRVDKENLNFHRLSACFLRDALCQQRQSALVGALCTIVASCTTMTIFIVGTHYATTNQMTLGKMLFVYGAAANLFGPVLMITQIGVVFSQLLVVLQRLSDILDEPIEIQTAPDAHAFPRPMQHGLSLHHVQFAYGEDSEPILKDVTMTIPVGSWICIMGPSGCGKTTVLYLLSRLYEPTAGEILVDDIPLAKIEVNSLRERLALVPQEAQIFRGTVRDNIAYGFPNAQPGEIMAAAKAAEMHDLIMGMKVKYESLIGERGTDLSGGQRQRMSLARALLTDPDVLLLDDCTSALDADTEHKIQETLTRIMKGKTAVIVSQRVSMAMRCRYIYVLNQGTITEEGTPEQLLQNNGFFARLHRQQTE